MGTIIRIYSQQSKMPLHIKQTIFLLLSMLSFTSAAPGGGPCNGDGSLEPHCDGSRLYFPHEFDCSKFWECGPNLKPCLFQCPPISQELGGGTLLFNIKAQTCDWPVYVDCQGPQTTTELINNSTTADATTDTATTDAVAHTTTTNVITTNSTAAQTTRNATTIHTATTTTEATTNAVTVTKTSAPTSTTTANPVTKTTTINDATSTTTTNDDTTINTAEHTTTISEVNNSTTIETIMEADIVVPQK